MRMRCGGGWVCVALLLLSSASTCISADDPVSRRALPPAEDRRRAGKQVEELFHGDRAAAKTPAQQGMLARKMIRAGGDSRNDPAAQYALFDAARETATKAGDFDTALEAADQLSRAFQIDGLKLRQQTLAALSAEAHGAHDAMRVQAFSGLLIEDAIAVDRFEIAKQAAEMGLASARKAKVPALISQAGARLKQVETLQSAYAAASSASQKLSDEPDDAEANLVVGRFYCLQKGDWHRGLPLLAKGNDATLKSLATADLAKPRDAAGQVALGDRWWTWVDKQPPPIRKQGRQHAGFWYRRAIGGLDGIAKLKLQRRMEELGAERDPFLPVGLVLYYSFEPETVTRKGDQPIVKDVSGSGNTGTIREVPFFSGGPGGSYGTFDGKHSAVDCGNAASLQITGPCTISAFVRLRGATSGTVIAKEDWEGEVPRGIVMRFWDGRPDVTIATDAWQSAQADEPLEPEKWYHLAGIFDGATVRLFIDGKEVASKLVKGKFVPSKAATTVGNDSYDRTRRFTGDIDEVMIFDRPLIPSEIRKLAAHGE